MTRKILASCLLPVIVSVLMSARPAEAVSPMGFRGGMGMHAGMGMRGGMGMGMNSRFGGVRPGSGFRADTFRASMAVARPFSAFPANRGFSVFHTPAIPPLATRVPEGRGFGLFPMAARGTEFRTATPVVNPFILR